MNTLILMTLLLLNLCGSAKQTEAAVSISPEAYAEYMSEVTTEITTEAPVTTIAQPIQPETINLGEFRISHYCPCSICNGGYTGTALGTQITPNRTIAVDPSIIPLGSKVIINDHTYIAEDTGGAIKGKRIDLCVSSHNEAYSKGIIYTNVYIVK